MTKRKKIINFCKCFFRICFFNYHKLATYWLTVFGIVTAINTMVQLSRKPEVSLDFTRPVAALELNKVLDNITNVELKQNLLEHFNKISYGRFNPLKETNVIYDDDNASFPRGLSWGGSPIQGEEYLKYLKDKLEFSESGIYVWAPNNGSPEFAFNISKKQFDGRFVSNANDLLYSSAANYFGFPELRRHLPRPLHKYDIEVECLKICKNVDEKIAVLESILNNKLVIRGIEISNRERYPVSGAILVVKRFPVPSKLAGVNFDGKLDYSDFGTSVLYWRLPVLDPSNSPERLMILCKESFLPKENFIIIAPTFQSAAQLFVGWWLWVIPSIIVLLSVLWDTVKKNKDSNKDLFF